jgi:putative restriction endonuclease
LIDEHKIHENRIFTNTLDYLNLEKTFIKYQKILGGRYKDKKHVICQPFFHLINDKPVNGESFWHLEPKPNAPAIEDIRDNEGRNRIKTEAKLKELIEYGKFDDELWELLQDSNARIFLTNVLVDTFFTENNNELDDILWKIDQDIDDSISLISGVKLSKVKYRYTKSLVRDRLFSKSVIYVYEHRCAVCKLMMKTNNLRFRSIVDAAHIKPFAEFNNNQLSNGISLCKNHHWAFDNGCFGIEKVSDEKYLVITSHNFQEESSNKDEDMRTIPLTKYHGKEILLPIKKEYRPDKSAIDWHRENHKIG